MLNTVQKISSLAWLDVKLYLRESIAVLWTVVVPILMLLAIGLFLPNGAKASYGPIIVPGLGTLVLLTSAIMGAIIPIIETREARIYEVLDVFGIRPVQIMLAHIISRGALSFGLVVVIFVAGTVLFRLNTLTAVLVNIPSLILIVALGVFLFFNMAITVSLFFKTSHAANAVGSIITGVLILLGGVYFDIAYLPGWIWPIAYCTPSYHITDLLRSVMGLGQHSLNSVHIVLVYTSLFLVTNAFFFDPRHKRHN